MPDEITATGRFDIGEIAGEFPDVDDEPNRDRDLPRQRRAAGRTPVARTEIKSRFGTSNISN